MKLKIPSEVKTIAKELAQQGFEAYLVGGCVRDLIMGREPKDWDIATNANPEKIQKIFPDSVYENNFGTVGVKTESDDPRVKIVEITTYRLEGKYTDKRHPDEVTFANTIEEDLSRRDFTMNAIALDLGEYISQKHSGVSRFMFHDLRLVDPYDGQEDIRGKIVRAVGRAEDRFNEDALRMLRAVRLAADLDFEIEITTRRAAEKLAGNLEAIAHERIRDEFSKMIMCAGAARGVILLEELDLLRYVMPELREGIGVDQNLHHIYTVFEHSVRSLDYAAKQNYSLEIRLAALLHDIGKPRTKGGQGRNSTFYNHEMLSARMVLRAMDRLHFAKDITEKTAHLVRW
ncbi:MAG: HD domain-containing protein, partial [Candidatus Liptonbacteria bacterium]